MTFNELLIFIINIISIVGSGFTIVSVIMLAQNQVDRTLIVSLAISVILVPIASAYSFFNLDKKHRARTLQITKFIDDSNKLVNNELFKMNYYNSINKLKQSMLDERNEIIIQQIVNEAEGILSSLVGEDVRVCIKYFSEVRDSEINSLISTLYRSSNSGNERKNNNFEHEAYKYSDYKDIILKEADCFYENSLKKAKYDNPTNWVKYYNTKIVVPIRVKIYEVRFQTGKLKAFLCADCDKSKAFKKDKETYIALMDSISRILYIYLEQYEILSGRLKEKIKEVAVGEA